jgi:Ser/Thr protein kinase RdoA (MazF antagonist)
MSTDPLKFEALSHFLPDLENVILTPTVGGVNNYCDHVLLYDKPNGNIIDRFVLRIYNNGLDRPRVDFEHSVLDKLLDLSKSSPLSFKIPTPVVSIKDNKSVHVILSNGYEATLFEYIPGVLPKKNFAKDIGRASGELVTALSKIDIDTTSPNPRFCDLYKAHHATTRDIFFAEIAKPVFDVSPSTRQYIDLLAQEVLAIEQIILKLNNSNVLPLQLIHADLHYVRSFDLFY